MQKVIWLHEKTELHPRTKQKGIFKIFSFKRKNWIKFILIFLILSVVFVTLYTIASSWKFEKVNYSGLQQLDKSQLDVTLSDLFNTNIFLLNPDEIERRLKNSFIEIETVRAEKMYKSDVNVYIKEKIPHLIYIDFNGMYLFDINGEVLKDISLEDKVSFNALDYELARGFGDLNAGYVEDELYRRLNEEELKEFKFEEYPIEKKEEILHELTSEHKNSIDERIKFVQSNNAFARDFDVPTVKAWDEAQFIKGGRKDKDLIYFLGGSVRLINNIEGLTVVESIWDGDQRQINTVSSGAQLILSPRRDLQRQIDDLKLILPELKTPIEGIKQIDLSSQKILVEYK